MAWRSEVMFSMKEITRRLHDVLQDRYGEHVPFIGLGLWFTISSCMALAKAVRDQHESEKITQKLDEAQAEAILREVA